MGQKAPRLLSSDQALPHIGGEGNKPCGNLSQGWERERARESLPFQHPTYTPPLVLLRNNIDLSAYCMPGTILNALHMSV